MSAPTVDCSSLQNCHYHKITSKIHHYTFYLFEMLTGCKCQSRFRYCANSLPQFCNLYWLDTAIKYP